MENVAGRPQEPKIKKFIEEELNEMDNKQLFDLAVIGLDSVKEKTHAKGQVTDKMISHLKRNSGIIRTHHRQVQCRHREGG
jgi:hypothetical protein